MKEIKFDKKIRIILVEVSIKNANKIVDGVFALDTGCTTTVVSPDFLERCNYSKKDFIKLADFTTGSGKEKGYEIKLKNINSLNLIRRNFKVIAYELPISFKFDGLLGTDFIQNKDLLISYKKGILTLS